MMPPAVYLQDVPEPKLQGKTNGDLAEWCIALREALRLANHDKSMLREWSQNRKD